MATSCPIGLDVDQLRREVSFIYARVAEDPSGDFHFHRGPDYATTLLGYDAAELAAIPSESSASFAGVGNPHCVAPIEPGETVVDIGCGAGTDLLLAARKVGPRGKAIGVDMTPAMAERARAGARSMVLDHVEVRVGDALELPVESGTIDVVISNGVINLTPDKDRAYAEAFRILKPGGRFQLADIIVSNELSENVRNDIDLWTGWIAGALPCAEQVEVMQRAGFVDVAIVARHDAFRGTSKEKIARKFGVEGISLIARKPR